MQAQDVIVEVFRDLELYSGGDLELHLAGSLPPHPEAREYFLKLTEAARGSNIHFYPNCSPSELRKLYSECDVYWHVTGIADAVDFAPERFEHFGITIVEAMSAGLIPVVLSDGGPGEIVEDGLSGIHIKDRSQLYNATAKLLGESESSLKRMRSRAVNRANYFSPEKFRDALRSAFNL